MSITNEGVASQSTNIINPNPPQPVQDTRSAIKFYGEKIGVKCAEFLKNSSCFIFHKRSKFRRFMIKVVLGGIERPYFKTVDELIDFYTQRINDKTDKVYTRKNGDDDEGGGSDKSEVDLEFMNESDDNIKFLKDVNSSAYIEEIRRV